MKSSLLKYGLLFGIIVALDQLSKGWILQLPATGITLLPVLSLVPTYNSGISWGMFHHEAQGSALWIILLVVGAIGLLITYTLQRCKQRHLIVPEIMVLAGACSNLIDRVTRGVVVDFIRFEWHGWEFPYFNIADSAIVIGVMGMLIYTFWHERDT